MGKETPEKGSPKKLSVDLDAMAAEAEKRPDILPRLKFGEGKLEEVAAVLEILEPSPRPFEFDSPFGTKKKGEKDTGLALNVRVHDADFDVVPGYYSLPMNADPKHGLTAGILKLWKRHGRNLEGKWVRIATRNYKHKTFGETRSYYVHEVAPNSLVTAELPSGEKDDEEKPAS